VEFSTDDSRSWKPATPLEPPAGNDTMVRWEGSFTIASGQTLTLVARATDGTGEVQTAEFTLPQPDGASGRHTIQVSGG
jgi:hypothetical protein